MKISARNAFTGKITEVKSGPVSAEIDLTTAQGERIVAIVTNESAKALGLAVGVEAMALVKASSVLVMTEGNDVKLSARNCLRGTVTELTEGAVNSEVTIRLAGGTEARATITCDAVQELGLKAGSDATAVFKASAVIIAVRS